MIKVEYVCTANNGRSKLAEAVARQRVLDRHEIRETDIEIKSSGSRVKQITKVPMEISDALNILRKGANYHNQTKDFYFEENDYHIANFVLQNEQKEVLANLVDPAFKQRFFYTAQTTQVLAMQREAKERDSYLQENGIEARAGRGQVQTSPVQDKIYLCMGQENADQIVSLTKGKSYPNIQLLHKFSGTAEIPNFFMETDPMKINAMYDIIKEGTEKSIDILLE